MSPQQQRLFLRETAGVYSPNDRVLCVRGDDARSWLSGQVTNDLRSVSREHAVYVLAVTVKGRVLTDGWVREDAPGLALVLPAERVQAALASFDKHIIMEDVELSVADGLEVVTVQGPRAAEVVSAAGFEGLAYAAPRLAGQGFDVWLEAQEAAAGRERLIEAARKLGGGPLDAQGWADAHVALAIPRCGVDFGEDSYPQEAGLKARAVSFNKGCYLGQEVICMLENRGQLNRRLVQLSAPGELALAPGSTLFDGEGKRVGELTSVAVTPGATPATQALGYLKRPVAELGRSVRAADHELTVSAIVGVATEECPIVARVNE